MVNLAYSANAHEKYIANLTRDILRHSDLAFSNAETTDTTNKHIYNDSIYKNRYRDI